MKNQIKKEIYNEISNFLSAFKCDNKQLLKQEYDVPDELFDEMNELILSDFTTDKQSLNLLYDEQRCSCGCTGTCIVNSSSIAYLLFSYK